MTLIKSISIVAIVVSLVTGPAALAAEKSKPTPYPLTTCIVSGEKLGEHGKPYVFVHENREIKLCCKPCLKDFKKDTASYLKKLDDAAKPKK